jgi:phosphate acetyltransferase
VIAGKHKKIKLPIFLTDAGLNENPTSQQLAIIAKQTVDTVRSILGCDVKVAFLSYSTKGSAENELTQKVKDAYQTFANANPEILCDGELQLDSALIERVAKLKCPQSPVAGKANVLIVPDLNVGNTLYKCMQYFGGLTAIGPIVQGLNKPVNDLSRGCSIKDIVLLTAVTVLQCEKNKNNKENKQ